LRCRGSFERGDPRRQPGDLLGLRADVLGDLFDFQDSVVSPIEAAEQVPDPER
jgi:hypothetical protein